MSYPKLILSRLPDIPGQPTRGNFMWENPKGIILPLGIRCLELPWLNNAPRKSCIPEGEYAGRYTMSSRFGRMMWAIEGVPARSGIRIHAGNYAGAKLSDSLGCPLPCMAWADINKDGVVDGTSSKQATELLEQRLEPYQKSGLTIIVTREA